MFNAYAISLITTALIGILYRLASQIVDEAIKLMESKRKQLRHDKMMGILTDSFLAVMIRLAPKTLEILKDGKITSEELASIAQSMKGEVNTEASKRLTTLKEVAYKSADELKDWVELQYDNTVAKWFMTISPNDEAK